MRMRNQEGGMCEDAHFKECCEDGHPLGKVILEELGQVLRREGGNVQTSVRQRREERCEGEPQ